MKRNDALDDIYWIIKNEEISEWDKSLRILAYVEDIGMLPPPSTCKIVEDKRAGGIKHSESKREWDEES